MSDPEPLASPVYQFPFPDDALVIIGRITLMWGQLDTQIDHLLLHLYRLDRLEFDHLFAGKMVGPKCDALRAVLSRCREDASREKVAAMVDAVRDCITDRNVLTHGLWGWRWEPEEGLWHACAWSRAKDRYFDAGDLIEFHNKVAKATVKADVAWYAEIENAAAPTNMNRRMMFSPHDPAQLPGLAPSYER